MHSDKSSKIRRKKNNEKKYDTFSLFNVKKINNIEKKTTLS